ncbi:MAG TPA: RDD family protein [Vicinamibacterales bacterium]|nr:RDD family protein [Vicinamibacterales bacterium]
MKCPKCQYISFDNGERCRNCGYDFSLVLDTPADDLPIQNGSEPIGPLPDLSLNVTPNLPLFTAPGDPDAPLVTSSANPRAPLSVRRTAPAAPRPRPRRDPRAPAAAAPRLALDTAEFPIVAARQPAAKPAPAASVEPVAEDMSAAAPIGARLIAGLIDLVLVGAIDLTVVYFTLKLCDLTFDQALTLPMAPLLSFLALLDGGYLATFVAASGQTIGKMAAGLRVVSAGDGAPMRDRVTFGQAAIRAAAYLASALPAGLGFLPVFIGQERRALHDRLADTRVVKA